MLIDFSLNQTSVILRVRILDTSGVDKTGLTFASTGLIIAAITDVEATTTPYTATASTIETITTLGTFAAPTATKCRFKQLDATNHPGIYELQIADARFAIPTSKSLLVSISGVTGVAGCHVLIPLRTVNPYEANFGLAGLVGTTAPAAGALLTVGTGAGQLAVAGGRGQADVAFWTGNAAPATNVNGVPVVDTGYVTGTVATPQFTIASGTAQAGGATSLTLANPSVFATTVLKGQRVRITGGTGAGQSRTITANNGTSSANVLTVSRAWTTTPDNTSTYLIESADGPAVDASLQVTAGALADGSIATATFAGGATLPRVSLADVLTTYTGNTVQTGDCYPKLVAYDKLIITGNVNDAGATAAGFIGNSGLSAVNDEYKGAFVCFTSGALLGIKARCTGYTGATKTFAFAIPFPAAPANASTFDII